MKPKRVLFITQAAMIAAYYSKGRDNDKVEIDYVEKKQVKKEKRKERTVHHQMQAIQEW